MKKKAILLASLIVSSYSFAAAYKIPEQSTRAMGTSAAYFAGAQGADTAYYNPAAMVWIGDNDKTLTEIGAKYIYLPRIKFTGTAYDPVLNSFFISDAKTSREEFLVPYFHLILPSGENLRVGFSFVTPYGLSKRWSAQIQKAYAEEFTLKTFEFDTTVAYKLDNRFSVGAGIRALYASGQIKYSYNGAYKIDMEGDSSINFGYLLSAHLKLTDSLNIATIYRSEIKPEVSGTAKGYLVIPSSPPVTYPISTEGSVKVVLPAEWRVGLSYKSSKATTIDLTYEITFWGRYKRLDINFDDPNVENTRLGASKPKYWHDSKTVRLGVIHKFSEKFTGMAGIAYDETPIPQRSQSFELPDSNGWIYSLGFLYTPSKNIELGVAYLYVKKFDRNVRVPTNIYGINGKFSDLSAHLVNLSLGYKF